MKQNDDKLKWPRRLSVLYAQWIWRNAKRSGPRPRPFLLLSSPRCGNNMVRSALQGHPSIHFESEIFLFAHDPNHEYRIPPGLKTTLRRAPEVGAVRCLLTDQSACAAGFTLFYDQMREENQERLWTFLGSWSDLSVIHLTRRDTFMQWLSLEEAMTSNLWLVQQGQSSAPTPPITLDPHRFYDWCERIESHRAFALSHLGHLRRIDIDYDDLTEDFNQGINDIQTFLHLTPQPLATTCRKIAIRAIPDRVANLKEFLEAIHHHPGARFVHEALERDTRRHPV